MRFDRSVGVEEYVPRATGAKATGVSCKYEAPWEDRADTLYFCPAEESARTSAVEVGAESGTRAEDGTE